MIPGLIKPLTLLLRARAAGRVDLDQRIHITMMLIEGKLREELSVDDLARSVNLSSSRFHHLFKANTGVGPARYLRTVRMELAKSLLETSFLSVKQIMNCAGFKDRSHFERDFKNHYGLTPTRIRSASQQLIPLNGSGVFDSTNRHKIAETAIQ
jgi:transcriptional regulator GlxA family with amidase domain